MPSNNSSPNIYIVEKGDSLWSISRKYNVTVEDLINANNLNDLTIYIGQELIIPSGNINQEPFVLYTVQKGDTLWNIAKKYNISVNNIMTANNLSSTLLSIGQQLIIPQ